MSPAHTCAPRHRLGPHARAPRRDRGNRRRKCRAGGRGGRAADSILGTTFFSGLAPDSFGRFTLALVVMFRVTAGMGWADENLPAVEPDGTINWGVFLFLASYILVVNWTLLQVRHAARWLCMECLLEPLLR